MSQDERWKYEKAYRLETYHLQGARLAVVMEDINSMELAGTFAGIGPAKYLDVGCGRGESVQRALELGFDAFGLEYITELTNERIMEGDIEDLQFDDGAFEYVSCYDVLEHLTPGTEQKALDELGRVCSRRLILSTNEQPSRLPTGEDLHVNKRHREIWHADIVERWGEANVGFSTFGPMSNQWHWVIEFAGRQP